MNDFLQNLLSGIKATSLLEWVAVATGIAYVILAARKSIWCWLFAFVSAAIYVYLCYSTQLFIEAILQVFYVAMAVVGYVLWERTKNDKLFVMKWPLKYHLINILLSALVAFLVGYLFATKTGQKFPYTDAFTTVFSLVATFLVTKKVLSNWLYWIVIDAVSIYLYASRDFYLTAVLYFLFTILAVYAWFEWKKQFKLQT